MTKQLTTRRKPSPFAALALLSVLLGAQVGVFAGIDPGTMPYSFNYGFNIGFSLFQSFGYNAQSIAGGIFNGCGQAFGVGTSSFNECSYGAKAGAKAAAENS